MRPFKINSIDRIIDANINRVKEGLRVCEEITRFILDSRSLTRDFKKIRHKIDRAITGLPAKISLLKARYSLDDVGRTISIKNEFKRRNYADIFFANIQRVKESTRVLEEFSKIKNVAAARDFKKIRYEIYAVERKAIQKINDTVRIR